MQKLISFNISSHSTLLRLSVIYVQMYKRNYTLRKEYLCYNVVDNNSIDDKTYDKLIIHMSTRYKLMFDTNITLY